MCYRDNKLSDSDKFKAYIAESANRMGAFFLKNWRPGVVGIYLDVFLESTAQNLVHDPLDVPAFLRHCVCVDCTAP